MLGAESLKKQQLESPVDTNVTPNTTEPKAPEILIIPHDTKLAKVAEMFGIMPSEIGKYNSDLDTIIKHADSMGAKTLEDLIYNVRTISDTLANNMAEKKIKTVARYLFLVQQRDKVNLDIERMKQ